jgi:hypothetical protein
VPKGAVDADGQNFGPQGLDLVVLGGNCRQFRGSFKGEIPGVEREHHPFAFVIRQLHLFDFATDLGVGLKIQGRLAHLNCNNQILLEELWIKSIAFSGSTRA